MFIFWGKHIAGCPLNHIEVNSSKVLGILTAYIVGQQMARNVHLTEWEVTNIATAPSPFPGPPILPSVSL